MINSVYLRLGTEKHEQIITISFIDTHTFHVHTFQLAKISKNPFFVLVLSNILIF